jgi:hypothetical protein
MANREARGPVKTRMRTPYTAEAPGELPLGDSLYADFIMPSERLSNAGSISDDRANPVPDPMGYTGRTEKRGGRGNG